MSFKVGILTSKAGPTTLTLKRGLSRFVECEIVEMSEIPENFEEKLGEFSIGMNYINSRQQITLGSIAESIIPVVNDVATFMRCKSKAYVNFLLRKNGIPVPRTLVVSHPYTEEKIQRVLDEMNFPLVIKPNFGSCGRASILAREEDDFRGILDYIAAIHEIPPASEKIFLVQEYIRDARDVRAFLVGEEIVAIEERVKIDGWKRNLAQGARPQDFRLSSEQEELVLKAAELLKVSYAGFDILSSSHGDYLLEVNPAPGLKISELHPHIFEKIAAFLKR